MVSDGDWRALVGKFGLQPCRTERAEDPHLGPTAVSHPKILVATTFGRIHRFPRQAQCSTVPNRHSLPFLRELLG